MGVRVDAARHARSSRRRRSTSASGRRVELLADGDDRLAVDQHVGAPGMVVIHDGAAADQDSHACILPFLERPRLAAAATTAGRVAAPCLASLDRVENLAGPGAFGFLVITGSEPPRQQRLRPCARSRPGRACRSEPSVSLAISPIMRFWCFSVCAPVASFSSTIFAASSGLARGPVPALHRGLARSAPSCRRRPDP